MNARNKGNAGEREWAKILNDTFGVKFARTPLSGGLDLKGDILKTYNSPKSIADDFHWEVKRVEKLNIHKALQQAIRDARPNSIPCVSFRRNNQDWNITLRASDFLNLLVELEELRKSPIEKKTEFEKHLEKKEIRRLARLTAKQNWNKYKKGV